MVHALCRTAFGGRRGVRRGGARRVREIPELRALIARALHSPKKTRNELTLFWREAKDKWLSHASACLALLFFASRVSEQHLCRRPAMRVSFTHRKIPMENGQRTMRHGFIIHSPQEEIILHEQRFHFSHHHQCSSHRGEGISHTDLQVLPTSGFVPTARNGRFIPTCRHGVSNRTDFKGTFAFHDFPVIGRYPFQVLTSLPLSGTGTH